MGNSCKCANIVMWGGNETRKETKGHKGAEYEAFQWYNGMHCLFVCLYKWVSHQGDTNSWSVFFFSQRCQRINYKIMSSSLHRGNKPKTIHCKPSGNVRKPYAWLGKWCKTEKGLTNTTCSVSVATSSSLQVKRAGCSEEVLNQSSASDYWRRREPKRQHRGICWQIFIPTTTAINIWFKKKKSKYG